MTDDGSLAGWLAEGWFAGSSSASPRVQVCPRAPAELNVLKTDNMYIGIQEYI